MRTLSVTVPNDFNLFLFGDDHMGTILRHNQGWDKMVKMFNMDYTGVSANLGIDHGDIIEAIAIDDPRFDFKTVQGNLLQQMEQAFQVRVDIAEKLLVVIDGNHPQKLNRYGDITKLVVTRLNQLLKKKKRKIIFGTTSCHITYKNKKGETLFRHFCTHGNGGFNSTADSPERREVTKQLGLKKKLQMKFSDCVLMTMGHTHKLIIKKPVRELCLCGNDGGIEAFHNEYVPHTAKFIHPDLRWYVNTGSFYRLFGDDCGIDDAFSGYAERALYDPIETGFAICRVRSGIIQGIDKIEV